MGLNKR